MSRNTAKYTSAKKALVAVGIKPAKIDRMSRENIYYELGKAGYEWDSGLQEWHKPAVAKSEIKRLRLIAEKPDLEAEINFVTAALEAHGGKVLDCAVYMESRNPKYANSTQGRAYISYVRSQA